MGDTSRIRIEGGMLVRPGGPDNEGVVSVLPTETAVLAAFERLYSGFVAPGDLVFDVGANIGENAAVFSALGTRVVAVEPLPQCAPYIGRTGAHVEQFAVGATVGQLELLVCSRALDVSSASPEWIAAMREAGLATGPWDDRVVAPMTTLD